MTQVENTLDTIADACGVGYTDDDSVLRYYAAVKATGHPLLIQGLHRQALELYGEIPDELSLAVA
jgi:hypothetical protein